MSGVSHLKCRDMVEFLMAYLDQELDGATREHFEFHLRACPNCLRYLETYKTTTEIARIAFSSEVEMPEEMVEPLIQAILSARTKI